MSHHSGPFNPDSGDSRDENINKHIQNRNKATMYDVSESFFTFYRQMVMLLDSFKTWTLPHLLQGKSDSVATDGGRCCRCFSGVEFWLWGGAMHW